MIVKLLNEHHFEFLSFKGGCRGSSESTHVKMPHCWKSHATAQILKWSSGMALAASRLCYIIQEYSQYGKREFLHYSGHHLQLDKWLDNHSVPTYNNIKSMINSGIAELFACDIPSMYVPSLWFHR